MNTDRPDAHAKSIELLEDICKKTGLSQLDAINLLILIGHKDFVCSAYNKRLDRHMISLNKRYWTPVWMERGNFDRYPVPERQDYLSALEKVDFLKFVKETLQKPADD